MLYCFALLYQSTLLKHLHVLYQSDHIHKQGDTIFLSQDKQDHGLSYHMHRES